MEQPNTQGDSAVERHLGELAPADVRDLAAWATDGAIVDPGDWHWRQIYGGGTPPTIGVYRVAGTGRDPTGKAAPWSMVLKAVRRAPTGSEADDPSARAYWKREILAYQSGFLADLPGDLAAPRCYGVTELPGDVVWLWLEDLQPASIGDGPKGAPWPLARYSLAATHFGVLNGTYLARWPFPSHPWLRPRVTPEQVPPSALIPDIRLIRDSGTWRDPRLGGAFTAALADRLLAQWERRTPLYDAFLRIPQTLCHWDAHRRNLFAKRDPTGRDVTFAIDWASTGAGPVGAELNNLVLGSIIAKAIDAADGAQLDAAVFPSYLAGLRQAGWRGDPRLARFGFIASAGLAAAPTLHWFLVSVLEQGGRGGPEDTYPTPTAMQLARWRGLTELALDFGDEALALLAAL